MPAPFTPDEIVSAFQRAPENVKLAIANIVMAARLDGFEEADRLRSALFEGVPSEVQDES